ncbi:MAG: hypothetical protein EAZ07_03860 [Cytophagales bacterium]|nr:MAG: hypothetical protein EAZ07_03860 [Cytophagales bacterium]
MKTKHNKIKLFLLSLIISIISISYTQAQSLGEVFGKNRIQKKNFKWQFISTQNFDVYYYDGGKDLANYAARYAEENFDRIIRIVGFSPYYKVKLLIYNTVAHAQQSNIGIEDPNMQIGGYTDFVKSKVELPFRGTRSQFNKDIDKGISNVLVNVMMYGGNLKDVVQSSFLLALPEWFLSGASLYISEGWSIEMDDYMRDLVRKRHIKRPSSMEGRQAQIVGQSIWNYIAKKYGEDNIANILNLTRIVRDEKESIENTLGIPYHIFINEWLAYYRDMEAKLNETYNQQLNQSERIKKNKTKHFDFRNLSISPNGSLTAYSQSFKGRYKIKIADSTGKSKLTIMRGGYKLINQPENRNIPIVAWQSQKRLAYITSKGNESYLNFYTFLNKKFYEINRKRKVKILLDDVREVLAMDFSSDGKYIAMSAVRKGQSDIYIYDVFNDKISQITNDIFDDLNPKFADNSKSIVFSSNRFIDSNKTKAKDLILSTKHNFNIYKFIPTDSVKRFEKYTGEGNNYLPQQLNDGIIFLSDRTGVQNLYKVSQDGKVLKQLTNYSNNIKYYNFHPQTQNLAFIMLNKGRENIYNSSNFDANQSIPLTPPTERAAFFSKRQKSKFKPKEDIEQQTQEKEGEESELTINVFNFESDKKKKKKSKTYETKKEPIINEFKSLGPYIAKPLFSFDHLVSTIKIDPLRGLGFYLNTSLSDMFGNHKMNAGALIITDLRSNSVFAEYQYLKHRIDYKIRYDRNTYNLFGENQVLHTYSTNNLSATASLPLTVFDKINISPMIMGTRYNEVPTANAIAILARDSIRTYAALNLEYVHDNTEITGMNMMVGSKWKFSYEQFLNIGNKAYNFGKMFLDFRHYQRLHKEIIFATRVSGGMFLGNSPKNFLLGGMDNWFLNKIKTYPSNDPTEIRPFQENTDLIFSPFVTNLRGFDYNSAFGPKFILLNAELRVPLIRYLYNGPISSNFFRNLQLIAFTDIGSAWKGASPFNQNNTINTNIIGNNDPFRAEVTNYISPWLYGYGGGLRTLFLGYYVKLDVAWGVLNYSVQSPKVYLTLGYDF